MERRLSHIQATQNYYPQFEISWWQCVYLHTGVCKIQWYNDKNKNSPTHGVKSLFNLFLTTKKRTRTDDDETVYLIIFKKKLQNVWGKKMLKNVNCHTTAAYYHKYDDEMTISIWRSLEILRDDTAYLHTAIHQW